MENCNGQHRYFVADVAQVEAEGTVTVIIVCTACGDSKAIKHQVAGKLLKLQKEK